MAQSPKALIALLMPVLFAGSGLSVAAQVPSPSVSTHLPKITLESSRPISQMLHLVFMSVGKQCVVDKDVQGYVPATTINYASTTFKQALQSIIKAADPPIAYDIKDNVYYFHLKHTASPDEVTQRISLRYTGPVRKALEQLFHLVGLDDELLIEPSVAGNVTVDIADVSFSTALRSIFGAVEPPLDYHVEGGKYIISLKLPPVY